MSQATGSSRGSTSRWTMVRNPAGYSLRYLPALRAYLSDRCGGQGQGDVVLRTVLMHLLKRGFQGAPNPGGRLADHLRRVAEKAIEIKSVDKPNDPKPTDVASAIVKSADVKSADAKSADAKSADAKSADAKSAERRPASEFDEAWRIAWRDCLANRTWRSMERHQFTNPMPPLHRALQIANEHERESINVQTLRLSDHVGRMVTPDEFAAWLHDGQQAWRRTFETHVAATLDPADHDTVRQEADRLLS
jgi:hypothetical protein